MIAFLREHDSPLAPAYRTRRSSPNFRTARRSARRRGEYWRLFGGPGTCSPTTSPLAGSRARSRVASARPHRPRCGVLPRRRRCAARGEGLPAPLLHPLLGPVGLTEQDDMENWNYAHKASPAPSRAGTRTTTRWGSTGRAQFEDHGCAARRDPGRSPRPPARTTSAASTRRCRQFMEAPSWAELKVSDGGGDSNGCC